MSFIARSWKGEEKLWKVFWLYDVLGSILIKLAVSILLIAAPLLGIVGYIFYVVYLVWLLVSLWRCAWNTEWTFWGYVVRGLVVLVPILIAIGLLIGGALAGHDILKANECRKIITEKAIAAGIEPGTYKEQHPEEVRACMTGEAQKPDGAH